jgi:hypothetical protein
VTNDASEQVGPDGEARRLPAGERVLWSGGPDRRSIARYFLRERWILGFVLLTFALQAADVLQRGDFVAQRLVGIGVLSAVLGAVALGGVWIYAWLLERTSKYVITDRRVYFNIGIVLRADAQVPYTSVDGLDVLRRSDGSADIMLSLADGQEIPWLLLYPHMSWRGSRRGRPTLRGLVAPQAAADALVAGLNSYAQSEGVSSTVVATGGSSAGARAMRPVSAQPAPA